MTSQTKATALETFSRNLRQADALLDWIGQELGMLEEYATKEGVDWSHSGSAQHYREELMKILIGLLGNRSETDSRKMIEEALQELEA